MCSCIKNKSLIGDAVVLMSQYFSPLWSKAGGCWLTHRAGRGPTYS